MRSINVAIPDDAVDRLRTLAARERRAPRDQAAILILAGLKAAGLDVDLASPERAALEPAEPRR